jgi:hypothetical protein
MKSVLIASVILVAPWAMAQRAPVLATPQAVDIRTESFQWQAHGEALLYRRTEENGFGVGIYRVGDPEGKVVLHLKKDDDYSAEWFDGVPCALVTVKRKITTPNGPANELDMYVLDAKQQSAYEVFSRAVSAPDDISADTELSPGLLHAIINIHEGKKAYHLVLPINGGQLVASPDIDQAEAQGFTGPAWSKDGTAIYGKGLPSGDLRFGSNGKPGTITLKAGNGGQTDLTGTIDLVLDSTASKVKGQSGEVPVLSSILAKIFLLTPAAPPVGTPVLEVVPANGVLRQVLSKGPWLDQPGKETALETETHETWINFDRSRGSAHSVWLSTGPENARSRTLIAPHADSAELAPEDKAVAYIVDGVLFVRRIQGQGQGKG